MTEKIKQFFFPKEEQWEHRWWHRLIRVLIILITITSFLFAILVVMVGFYGYPSFILSFESGYDDIRAEEQTLEDYGPSVDIIERIENKYPHLCPTHGSLYKRYQRTGEVVLELNVACFEKIIESYPNIKVKSYTPKIYSVFLFFLIVPITYFGLWVVYRVVRHIILYIVFGSKHKTK